MEGTYEWSVVASEAIVAHDLGGGLKVIAAPSAEAAHHRICTVGTQCEVGTVGHLRYVSNYPKWGRLEFEAHA